MKMFEKPRRIPKPPVFHLSLEITAEEVVQINKELVAHDVPLWCFRVLHEMVKDIPVHDLNP